MFSSESRDTELADSGPSVVGSRVGDPVPIKVTDLGPEVTDLGPMELLESDTLYGVRRVLIAGEEPEISWASSHSEAIARTWAADWTRTTGLFAEAVKSVWIRVEDWVPVDQAR